MSVVPLAHPEKARRYPARVAARACTLRNAGWSYARTREMLYREFGVRPSDATILAWVDPDTAHERQRQIRARARRSRPVTRPGWFRGPRQLTDDEMLRLRECGLSYSALAVIAREFYGTDTDEDALRRRLVAAGAPKNPNKGAGFRRLNAERGRAA